MRANSVPGGTIREGALFFQTVAAAGALFKRGHYSRGGTIRASTVCSFGLTLFHHHVLIFCAAVFCVYVCMCVSVYMYLCICVSVCLCVCVSVCMCGGWVVVVGACAYLCICMCACVPVRPTDLR